MRFRSASVALGTTALLLQVPAAGSETLYFKNKRTLEAESYKIKGPLIYVTMSGGKVVYLRADSVDWEGTKQIQSPDIILQRTDYDAVDDVAEAGGVAGAPAERLTAADLRKSGSGFKLRRAGASSVVVDVPANQTWIDSRITVRTGQVVNLRVSGTATVAPGIDVGPDGSGSSGASTSALVPGQPFGAVIARIGLGSEPFMVGGSLKLVAPAAGRLFFAVNDRQPSDNQGSFSVRIELPQGATGTATSYHGYGSAAGSAEAGLPAGTPGTAPPGKGFVGGIDRARSAREAAESREKP